MTIFTCGEIPEPPVFVEDTVKAMNIKIENRTKDIINYTHKNRVWLYYLLLS